VIYVPPTFQVGPDNLEGRVVFKNGMVYRIRTRKDLLDLLQRDHLFGNGVSGIMRDFEAWQEERARLAPATMSLVRILGCA
jgi:hypothetical protein